MIRERKNINQRDCEWYCILSLHPFFFFFHATKESKDTQQLPVVRLLRYANFVCIRTPPFTTLANLFNHPEPQLMEVISFLLGLLRGLNETQHVEGPQWMPPPLLLPFLFSLQAHLLDHSSLSGMATRSQSFQVSAD